MFLKFIFEPLESFHMKNVEKYDEYVLVEIYIQ